MEDSFRHGCLAKTLAAYATREWRSRSYSVGPPVIFGINEQLDLIDLTLDIHGLASFEASMI